MKWRERAIWSAILIAAFLGAQTAAVQFSAIVRRALPTAITDGTGGTARLGRYAETYSLPLVSGTTNTADEGSYFHAMTSTPGTAYNLSGATQTAWVATTPTFTVKNNDSENAKRFYMDFVRISAITANTGGTNFAYAVVVDNITRYSSGGTALTVYNANMDSTNGTLSTQAFAGVVTATAAGAGVRYICRGNLKNAILAVGDSLTITFGQFGDSTSEKMCPPAIIGGGDSVVVYTWATGQTATATGEVSAGWWER